MPLLWTFQSEPILKVPICAQLSCDEGGKEDVLADGNSGRFLPFAIIIPIPDHCWTAWTVAMAFAFSRSLANEAGMRWARSPPEI